MRLWSLSPKYLDPLGLSRNYFEGLRGYNTLIGLTKIWKNHSQLVRFKKYEPISYLSFYLLNVLEEAKTRDLYWSKQSVLEPITIDYTQSMSVTEGQIEYEINWLLNKLKNRQKVHQKYIDLLEFERKNVELHPIFYKVSGDIEPWEKVKEFSNN